jgi:catechol 2,3-dioxygenase-like lactoylglutathione lyase family enzyme
VDVAVIPVLPARDLDATIRFYGALGFSLVYEQEAPDPYAILELHGEELHFFEHRALDPTTSITGCYLRVTDADALFRVWSTLGLGPTGLPRIGEIADRPWGMREFHLVDPSGNLIRVGHPIE